MKTIRTRQERFRPSWRSRAWTGAWVAAVVGIVVLFVGNAAASPAAPTAKSFTEKPPYAGVENSDVLGLLSGSGGPLCGVAEKFPVSPFFNLTTGHGNLSVAATARSCGPGTSFASPEEDAGFNTANFTTTTGLHDIKATWNLDFTVKLKAAPGNSSQSATAYVIILLQLYLLDVTNGTVFSQNNSPFFLYEITTGTYDHTFPKLTQIVYLNASLVKGHEYSLGAYVYLNAYASVSPGSSSASAVGNMGAGGRSAFLPSLTGL